MPAAGVFRKLPETMRVLVAERRSELSGLWSTGELQAFLDGLGEECRGGGCVGGDDLADVGVELCGACCVADGGEDLFEAPVVVSDAGVVDGFSEFAGGRFGVQGVGVVEGATGAEVGGGGFAPGVGVAPRVTG